MRKIMLVVAALLLIFGMTLIVHAEERIPSVGQGADYERPISPEELNLLARLVYAEANTQDYVGKKLVVDVVLNRMYDKRFPNTITGVIYQKGQFGPVSNGALDRAPVTDECVAAVLDEMMHRVDEEILYFCTGGYSWGTPVYKYGDHYFSK